MSLDSPAVTKRVSQRSRVKNDTGFSTLARGEPFIWLSGGMLVICLSMIIGLLGLLIYQGLITFWPKAIHLIANRDGTLLIGELENRESYTLTKDELGNLPAGVRSVAEGRLGSQPSMSVSRSFYRTGNFDLSGKHFSYATEVDSFLDQILMPADVWTVERLSNGRFYGFPVRLESHSQIDSGDEMQSWSRLENALLRFAASDEVSKARETKAIEWISKRLLQVRSSEISEWIENRKETFEAFIFKLKDGTNKSGKASELLAALNEAAPIQVLGVLWNEKSLADYFNKNIAKVTEERDQLETLSRQISILDRRQNAARVSVRNQELQSKSKLLDLLDPVPGRVQEWKIKTTELQRFLDAISAVSKIADIDPEVKGHFESTRSTILDEMRRAEEEIESYCEGVRKELAGRNGGSGAAIENFFKVIRDLADQRIPIQDELSKILSSLEEDRIIFAYSATESPVAISDAFAAVLRDGKPWSDEFQKVLGLSKSMDESILSKAKDGFLWSCTEPHAGKRIAWISKGRGKESESQFSWLKTHEVKMMDIVRAFPTNGRSLWYKSGIYRDRWWEFVSKPPREANMEGGVFPAIWGTVVMTMIMTLVVVPFGVMASLYLKEYAKPGPIVSIIRVSINNLAGVPSVVYGVFGLAFFCYVVGGYIDGGPEKIGVTPWPTWKWFFAFGMTAILGFGGFYINIACASNPTSRSIWKERIAPIAGLLWLLSLVGIVILFVKTPFFDGFYQATLPSPTFGKGGLAMGIAYPSAFDAAGCYRRNRRSYIRCSQ